MSENSKRVLVVEDDGSLQKMLVMNLEAEGYHVVAVGDGVDALEVVRNQRIDALVLDVMLPVIDGYQVCSTIRLEGHKMPILFLTAKNSGPERVEGLKLGADDYLGKPFNVEELLLRLARLIEQSRRGEAGTVGVALEMDVRKIGTGEVRFGKYQIVTHNGKVKTISKRETMLLRLLTNREGDVVSRDEILETVWGYSVYPNTRTIDNYLLSFRKYFEPNPKKPIYFHSVRGVGYRFEET
ncbi:MAG: DNA-binding response regulator [Bacteroidetes bacterium]|nr:MAG: DNA-binding response regulator [Bacteroidota bacterium]